MMSGVEMKTAGQSHTYPPAEPPPYTAPPPSYGPTVIQPGTSTIITPGNTTVIHGPGIGPTPIVLSRQMSPGPAAFVCPSCNHQIVTRVEYKPSSRTHLFALLLCVVGCWPCMCIPYCMDSCNNANHYCPNCNAYIGTYTS